MHRHITYSVRTTHNQLSARVDSTSASPQINFLVGGFGGMLPRENNFEWGNLVHFGAYFHEIFNLKKSNNIHFLYKNIGKL